MFLPRWLSVQKTVSKNQQTASIFAVVPVKDLTSAKQRLSPVLNPDQRRGLYRAMLEDVLTTLSQVTSLAGIMLVTRDREVCDLAKPFSVQILSEASNDGHSVAVNRAARALCEAGASGLIQIPGDVPLVSVADIEMLLQAHNPAPAVTITPSHDRRGSNAMLTSPPDVLPFAFGSDSFYPHLSCAREIGIEPTIVELANLSLDIDEPADLRRFTATPSSTRAYAYLSEAGLLSV